MRAWHELRRVGYLVVNALAARQLRTRHAAELLLVRTKINELPIVSENEIKLSLSYLEIAIPGGHRMRKTATTAFAINIG